MQFSKCEETQNPKAPQLEMNFFADHAESMFLAGETRGDVVLKNSYGATIQTP